jgi:hypothetical protein
MNLRTRHVSIDVLFNVLIELQSSLHRHATTQNRAFLTGNKMVMVPMLTMLSLRSWPIPSDTFGAALFELVLYSVSSVCGAGLYRGWV